MGSITRLRGGQDMTAAAAVEKYLAHVGMTRSKRTRTAYALTLAKFTDEFGGLAVDGLDPDAVAEWFTGRWGDGSAAGWNANRAALTSAAEVVAEAAGHPVRTRTRSAGSAGGRCRRTGPGPWTGPRSRS